MRIIDIDGHVFPASQIQMVTPVEADPLTGGFTFKVFFVASQSGIAVDETPHEISEGGKPEERRAIVEARRRRLLELWLGEFAGSGNLTKL